MCVCVCVGVGMCVRGPGLVVKVVQWLFALGDAEEEKKGNKRRTCFPDVPV